MVELYIGISLFCLFNCFNCFFFCSIKKKQQLPKFCVYLKEWVLLFIHKNNFFFPEYKTKYINDIATYLICKCSFDIFCSRITVNMICRLSFIYGVVVHFRNFIYYYAAFHKERVHKLKSDISAIFNLKCKFIASLIVCVCVYFFFFSNSSFSFSARYGLCLCLAKFGWPKLKELRWIVLWM